jgi:cytoskeletal protein CcmA (bactofilin family)
VDGKLVGDVSASESVAVGLSGEIEGNVTAKNITVGGKIRGAVSAADKIIFENKSVVRGDIRAMRLVIDEGAVFDGRVAMAERGTSSDQRH